MKSYLLLLSMLIAFQSYSADLTLTTTYKSNVELAKNGDAQAMYDAAIALSKGKGTNRDHIASFKYMQSAAANNHLDALKALHSAYSKGLKNLSSTVSNGWVVEANSDTANLLINRIIKVSKEAANDSPTANLLLGNVYTKGIPDIVNPDPFSAHEYFQKAFKLAKKQSDNGNMDSRLTLASIYEGGTSATPKDLDASWNLYNSLDNTNHVEGKYFLAKIVAGGLCCKPIYSYAEDKELVSKERAIDLLLPLAKQGHHDSQVGLSNILISDCTSTKCQKDALYWIEKAVAQYPNDYLLNNYAEISTQLGHYENAVMALLTAATISPHPNHARQNDYVKNLAALLRPNVQYYLPEKYAPLREYFAALSDDKKSKLIGSLRELKSDLELQNLRQEEDKYRTYSINKIDSLFD